jgi:rhamnogalacturonyl hydrolase YesR
LPAVNFCREKILIGEQSFWERVVMSKLSVQMTDSTMARFPVLAEEWNYQWGLVLRGVEHVWRATGDNKYFAYIQSNMDRFVQADGTIRGYRLEEYNVDRLNTGKALFPLYEKTGDAKYKRALDLLHSQLATHPRTPSQGLWHKQIYPNQMWLDGIYMADAFSRSTPPCSTRAPVRSTTSRIKLFLLNDKRATKKTACSITRGMRANNKNGQTR